MRARHSMVLLALAAGCAEEPPAGDTDVDPGPYAKAPVFAPLLDDGTTVAKVDVDRYLGTWFELGTYPIVFQRDCAATTATYTPRDEGGLVVRNWCALGSPDGEPFEFVGKALPVDETNARLDVSFFGDFGAPYWVLERDDTPGEQPYAWAIVGGPTKDTLWLLAREPILPEDFVDALLEVVAERGYDVDAISWTEQRSEPPAGAVPGE